MFLVYRKQDLCDQIAIRFCMITFQSFFYLFFELVPPIGLIKIITKTLPVKRNIATTNAKLIFLMILIV